MAESHGEDAPLLGDPPSPSHTISPTHTISSNHTSLSSSHTGSPSHNISPTLSISSSHNLVSLSDTLAPTHTSTHTLPSLQLSTTLPSLQLPPFSSNKLRRGQGSMDSGCESDEDTAGETLSTSTVTTMPQHHLTTTTTVPSQLHHLTTTTIPYTSHIGGDSDDGTPPSSDTQNGQDGTRNKLSPLSPSQPGVSEPSSPGGSGVCTTTCIEPPQDTSNSININTPCNTQHNGSKQGTNTHIKTHDSKKHTSTHDRTDTNSLTNLCSYIKKETSTREQYITKAHSQDILSKVTFRIEGEEGEEDDFDNRCPSSAYLNEIQYSPLSEERLTSSFPRIPSYTKGAILSATSSTASMPFCRICHLPEGDGGVEALISPCRCAGTMEFIHHGCLMKWLEVSSSRYRQVPSCELCNYQFHRRKKFRLRHCQLPSCSRLDKILHCVFIACVILMLATATVTVVCFKQNSNPRMNREDTELTQSEVITLSCGVMFFVAFFVAMYVEVKATDTIYRLCSSFFYINQTMHIYEYDKKKDLQQTNAPV